MVHIETKNKSYDTDTIQYSGRPSSSGKYFICDADGKGIYASEDQEMAAKIFAYAKDLEEKGETIRSSDLKRQEFRIKKEMEKAAQEKDAVQGTPVENPQDGKTEEQKLENEWDTLKKELEEHLVSSAQIQKERDALLSSISQMEQNEAPADVVKLAKEVQALADESHDRFTRQAASEEVFKATAPEADTPVPSPKQPPMDQSYVMYRLENKLLARANAGFKAGIMSAYETVRTPLRLLHQHSLKHHLAEETKNYKQYDERLQAYLKKLQEKSDRRLAKENRTRARYGKALLSPDSKIYTEREQKKLDKLFTEKNNSKIGVDRYTNNLQKSQDKYSDRMKYVSENRSILRNELITERHKKVFYQAELIGGIPDWFVPAPEQEAPKVRREAPAAETPDIGTDTELPWVVPVQAALERQTEPVASEAKPQQEAYTPPEPSSKVERAAEPDVILMPPPVAPLPPSNEEQKAENRPEEKSPDVVSIPIYAPDGSYLGEQEIAGSTAEAIARDTDAPEPSSQGHEAEPELETLDIPKGKNPSIFLLQGSDRTNGTISEKREKRCAEKYKDWLQVRTTAAEPQFDASGNEVPAREVIVYFKDRATFERAVSEHDPSLGNDYIFQKCSERLDRLHETVWKEEAKEALPEPQPSAAPLPQKEERQGTAPEPSPLFTPMSERFSSAKQESRQGRDQSAASGLYKTLATRLPANSFIEFDVGGDAFKVSRNEYGDMSVGKYDFETSRYTPVTPEQTIDCFKKDVPAFEDAVRAQLGDILIRGDVPKTAGIAIS